MPIDKVQFVRQAVERMAALVDSNDPEASHAEADALLCMALQGEGGYEELLALYEEVPR